MTRLGRALTVVLGGPHRLRQRAARRDGRMLCQIAMVGLVLLANPLPIGQAQSLSTSRLLVVLAPPTTLLPILQRALNDGTASPPSRRVVTDFLRFTTMDALNQELIAMGPALHRYDALVASSHNVARVLQLRAPGVPVVFEGLSDPIKRCLVDSYTRPGRSATGYAHYLPSQTAKMMQVLHDGFPSTDEQIVLVGGGNVLDEDCNGPDRFNATPTAGPCEAGEQAAGPYLDARLPATLMAQQAKLAGYRLRFVVVCDLQGLQGLSRWAQSPIRAAWVVPWHGVFYANTQALVRAIAGTGLPAIYAFNDAIKQGGLMALVPQLDSGADRSVVLALQRVLKGENPADMPVQSPRGFRLVVNAKVAQNLGPRPSAHVLRIADELIH